MDDAAARRHPLNVAGRDGTAVAHAIAVLNSSRQDIRDGFDPAMRVPREPSQIILGNVVAEIVQEKEWIEVGCIAESESAAKMHASAFERRLGLNESLNGPNGHFGLLDAEVYPVISGGVKFTPLSWSDRQPAKFARTPTDTDFASGLDLDAPAAVSARLIGIALAIVLEILRDKGASVRGGALSGHGAAA
jgi:hypothetical protein